MAKEIELKYSAPEGFNRLCLFGHPRVEKYRKRIYTKTMHTKYLDTENRDFAKERITLRQRIENNVSYIYAKNTEKAEGGFSVRNEWRIKSDCLETAAKRLSDRGAPAKHLAGIPLIATSEVEFCRYECRVIPHEGFEYMLSYDVGFFNKKVPFAEMELELICGNAEELIAEGEAIANSLSFIPEKRSKHERALTYR